MGYNYGREVKKFEVMWKQLREEYVSAGMSEDAIQEMYDFDWEQFIKSERRFRTHNQSLQGFTFSDGDEAGEDQSPLLGRYIDRFSVSQPEISEWGRYDWVEDIETPELAQILKSLPEKDLELITCLSMDGMSRADVSREMGVSRAAITKQVSRIKKVIEQYRQG